MAFDVGSRKEYLARLRERAVERMRQDERAERAVSRREAVRWVGLAAAAAAVGVRPLRVSAEGPSKIVGALRMRAAMMGSARGPAPQYGAPMLPEPRVEFEPDSSGKTRWGIKVPTAESREELGMPGLWADDYAMVIPANGKTYGPFPGNDVNVTARVIYYAKPWSKLHSLDAISSPRGGETYVVPGGQAFYVEEDGELWGFRIDGDFLYVRKSFFHAQGIDKRLDPVDRVSEAIREFAKKVNDRQMREDEDAGLSIRLHMLGAGNGSPALYSIAAEDGVVTIRTMGGGGSFSVDWKAKTVLDQVKTFR